MQKHFSDGLIQIYTGNGKGKTTAAFGLAIRAYGRGVPVFIIQFMKTGDTGEIITCNRLGIPNYSYGREDFINKANPASQDKELAKKALDKAQEIMRNESYGLLILDEIINAIDFGLIADPEVIEMLEKKPRALEIILTGRNASSEIMEKADLITEMEEIRHPWQKKIAARLGIEW